MPGLYADREKAGDFKIYHYPPLWAEFKIFENGKEEWIIACRKCNARWSLVRKTPVHTGNILAMMNHADSHMPDLADSL